MSSVGGKVAQNVMARSLAAHRNKDNHAWAIRRLTVIDPGNALEQPITSWVEEELFPVVTEINEYEASAIGQNLLAGDLRLVIDGTIVLDETTLLICDSEKCDIYRAPAVYFSGVPQERVVYVRRRRERTDV